MELSLLARVEAGDWPEIAPPARPHFSAGTAVGAVRMLAGDIAVGLGLQPLLLFCFPFAW